MKTLSIETSSKICSIAILEDNKLIKKIELDNGLTHSETLMPLIKQILEETHFSLSEMDLLVCDIGPGSFTGIRIGVATVKAFSDSLNIPAVGISSLEALAYSIKDNGYICSIIDCKNDNCYYALYSLNNSTYTLLEVPKADSVENCLNYISYKYPSSPITFVGDGSTIYYDTIKEHSSNFQFANNDFNNIDVYSLGIAGINKYNQYGKDKNLLPLYLKKPQAQRQLESKNIVVKLMQFSDLKNLNLAEFDDFWNMEILQDELKSEYSKCLCAILDNEIVGFVVLKTVLDEADIMNIAVKKNFRRQGIASLLLNKLLVLCQENKVRVIHLEVNEENFSAISLYKKFGFKECGRRKQYYDNHFDAVLMDYNISH